MNKDTLPDPPPITENQVQLWRDMRVQRASRAIEAALTAERCEIRATPSFTPDGRIVVQMTVVAL